MRNQTQIRDAKGRASAQLRGRIEIDLTRLSGLDAAQVEAMVDALPDDTDLGDQRAIIVAIAGRFDPCSIDRLIDHVTEQARIQRAELAHGGRLGELLAAAVIFASIPLVGLATLIPTEAMAADVATAAASDTWGWIKFTLQLAGAALVGFAVGICKCDEHHDEPAPDLHRDIRRVS